MVGGLQLKFARLKAGLKQYELASKLGIDPARLSEIEAGRRQLSPELAKQIDQILREQAKNAPPQH